MKTFNSLLLAAVTALAVLFAPAVEAAGYGVGTITSYYVISTGVIIFNISASSTGQPACATYLRYAFDPTTTAGKVQNASLLSAFLANKNVGVWGTGTCSVYGDSETLSQLLVTY